MPDPITPEDLYGPSNSPTPEGLPAQAGVSPIPIEETPEITIEPPRAPAPIKTPAPAPASIPTPPKPETSFWSTVGALLLFVGLFVVGMFLSNVIRQYFPNGLAGVPQQVAVTEPAPTLTPTDPLATWKTYPVISGTTKLPVEGVSYKLPPDILSPICDATTCASQGTYLPGGTRLTVAPRGVGQLLVDYRGSAISDVLGAAFTTQNITVNGYNAKLFTGIFSGRTVAGYGFSQMRGYMIEVSPTLSLEINHFTPTGVTADFVADDALFDKIVGTLVLSTSTPQSATTSGY